MNDVLSAAEYKKIYKEYEELVKKRKSTEDLMEQFHVQSKIQNKIKSVCEFLTEELMQLVKKHVQDDNAFKKYYEINISTNEKYFDNNVRLHSWNGLDKKALWSNKIIIEDCQLISFLSTTDENINEYFADEFLEYYVSLINFLKS